MEQTAMMQSGDLLKQCRRIFGEELVVNAWITTWDINSDPKDVMKRLRESRIKDDGTDCLSYDTETIIIQFSNGRKVIFLNSEWATISLCNDELVYQV